MTQPPENPLDDVSAPSRLDLLSPNDLAYRLGLSRSYIEQTSGVAGRLYDPFPKQPKWRWFPKRETVSKQRIIDNPAGGLKLVQKRIARRLLRPLVFPHYLCGGIRNKSVLENVAMHLGARVLVTLDIRNFFPTITHHQVYAAWTETLGCSPPVGSILTTLTTFRRHLPQGAPTSTLLANLVLYHVDAPIRAACGANGVRYSTWVDDLAFSGERATKIIPVAVEALRQAGFAIAHRKLKIMGSGGRMILNGVVLGRFPGIVRARVSQLRSGIHKLRVGAVPPANLEEYCQSLESSILHLSSIVPRRGKLLKAAYDGVCAGMNVSESQAVGR